jgi:3-oxoacyl-[acyl-carrier protein] reductase
MRLKNKIALITGAGKGIERSIALEFAKEGAVVIINYFHSKNEAKNVVKKIKKLGGDALVFKANVANFNEVMKMVKKVISILGRIDILVNNAGLLIPSNLENTTEKIWEETINVNLKGAFNCIKAVVPYMKKQKYGKIINISSIAGIVGSSTSIPYGISKAGLINLTKTLAKNLGKYNITINCIAPGPVNTDLIKKLDKNLIKKFIKETPLKRIAEPEDVAKVAVFFSSSDSDFITGQTLIVDGGRIIL